MVAFWICLDGFVPKASCLEVVKGSHTGPHYDVLGWNTVKGRKYTLPPIPDVPKQRRAGEVEVLSWELQPGDVLVLHPHATHGNAEIMPNFSGSGSSAHPFFGDDAPGGFRQRRTLILRFFGERLFYKEPALLPSEWPPAILDKNGHAVPFPMPWLEGLADGEPFWHAKKGKQFVQVKGSAPARL